MDGLTASTLRTSIWGSPDGDLLDLEITPAEVMSIATANTWDDEIIRESLLPRQ